MSMLIGNTEVNVLAAAQYDLAPPAGEAWCIVEVGSDQPGLLNVPDLQLEICDGAHNDAILVLDPGTVAMAASDKGTRRKEIYITPTDYLGIVNTAGGAAVVSWSGYRVSPNVVITDMYTVPASAVLDVIPPAGQVWRITEIGVQAYGAAFHGDVTIRITDGVAGTLLSNICDTLNDRGWWKLLNWYIDANIYLRFLDTSTVDNDIAIVGTLEAVTSVGSVQDVLAGANLDIQPPDGQEWIITEISAELWAGAIAPDQIPDVTVSFFDDANVSNIMEEGSAAGNPVFERWNSEMELHIDNAFYLRLNNANAAANEIGLLGYLRRQYA